MKPISLALTFLTITALAGQAQDRYGFIDAERALAARFGEVWSSLPQATISAALVEMAESLPVSGAIDLPRRVPSGVLDFRRVADGVQITGGRDGRVIFGSGQHGLELLFSHLDQEVAPGVERTFAKLDPFRPDTQLAARTWTFKDGAVMGNKLAPMSDYLALFCSGGIRIKADVKNCAWIAGDNAFGDHVVTAEARVDDSLFLWFGLNWPFQNFNGHWNPANKDKDWVKDSAQMHFDLKGGGAGTRLYHMIETNYGNPGPGVILEIPAGTFLLKQPLYLLGGISGVWGTGEKSVLKTDAPIHVVKMQERCTVAQLAIEGGTVGLALTGADHHYNEGSPTKKSYIAGENFYAITFKNQTLAGLLGGNDDVGVMGGSEHDQNKYVDLKFENTGDYGICMNGSMLDKWLVLHSESRGQKKAGIAVKFNNLIHGMIVGSRFENIGGPGVDTFGGNPEIGYRPWEVWIDGCEFTECGNEREFAVEMGIAELSAITHSTITTKKKAIAGGYAGSPQIFEDCTIDVNLAPDAPAVKLRAVRTISVSRANGHVIRNVKANGPLVFVNDANAQTEHFAKTVAMLTAQGKPHVEKWDTNSMAAALAPKNGWVHPFVFYKSEFGAQKFGYELLNVDVDKGAVKERVDLAKFE